MNRRLRKKLHLGEFREDGFQVDVVLLPDLTDEQREAVYYGLTGAIEAIGCDCGGGGNRDTIGLYVTKCRGTCSESDRDVIDAHLRQSTLVRCHAVGPLQDAWHGSERAFLEADLAQVDQLLDETPDDGSLGRRSLEQHRERVRAELEAV